MSSKCDLHVHSSASVGNDEWYTRLFDCPESYAPPLRQYELCKARGMTLVTLTDHDTIAGGLTLRDRPDFFLSEEVTAVFPENGCVMHVLAWNITPGQHEEIQARRRDIYRLCEYLNREGIAHGLAHPLLSPSWQLDADTFEKLILLFPTMETVNGLTDRRIEWELTALLERLTPDIVAELVTKHGFQPYGAIPHRKAFTAGSDDHVQRRCGSVFVELDESDLTAPDFVRGCVAGRGRVRGRQAHLNTMALCVKHTTYHHLKERESARANYRSPFVDMMDVVAGRQSSPANSFVASLLEGAERAALAPGRLLDILRVPLSPSDEEDARFVEGVTRLSDRVIERAIDDLVSAGQEFDLYTAFGALRDLAGGLVVAAPVFFAGDHFGKQEQQARRIWQEWRAFPLPERRQRLAVFSDSLDNVDGVSTWCRRLAKRAHAAGRDVLLPHCGGEHDVERLPALTSGTIPLYPKMRFHFPSLIGTLSWAWHERITHVELATPGPMGLVGLLVAKVLRLPVTATYHTELPGLVRALGGAPFLERAVRSYLSWFYTRLDRVFAFSAGSRETLIHMGVAPASIGRMPIAVDPDEFSPAHRSHEIFGQLHLEVGDRPVVLTVGRLSEEKNVPVIVEAVAKLQERKAPPVLVIVGDGPEGDALRERYGGLEFVRFAGFQRGDTLKKLYASATAFVFASLIDTLGIVNMEAMASGVPVLLPTKACAAEIVADGLSGECYEFGVDGLAAALRRILDDPSLATTIGVTGRRTMIQRWQKASFSDVWNAYMEVPQR
jgi:glycosyltransferase involved in cell wall biosynthesis